ncbi:MAG: MoaD/ThiS family protein [Saprospiraceae bacterium]|nr:MoaD/ThiS family protein [Lewinellaceae bacterium]
MMKIKILAFGIAREICKGNSFTIEIPDNFDSAQLKNLLVSTYPGLKDLAAFQLAVNEEWVGSPVTISESDEIAILPPVSGG